MGYWSGLALCLTKVRSSRARCPATALIQSAKINPGKNVLGDKNLKFDIHKIKFIYQAARWRSGRASDSELRGPGFDPHRRHRVVSFEQDTLTPYSTG